MLYRFLAIAKRSATLMVFSAGVKPLLKPSSVAQSILLRSSTCQVMQNSQFHHKSINYFASSHDWNDSKPPVHPLIEKIQQHPQIMDQLVDFTNLLQSKGVDVSGKQPSFMQIMKVMNDPEIKEKVQKLAQSMQAAGIQLDMNTIQELQSNFASLANGHTSSTTTYEASEAELDEKKPLEEEQQHGRKRGVMNRVKGLFKK